MKVKTIGTLLLSGCILFSAVAEAGTLNPYSGIRPGFNVKKQQIADAQKAQKEAMKKQAKEAADAAKEAAKEAKEAAKTAKESVKEEISGKWRGSGNSSAYIMKVGLATGLSVASVCMNTQYNLVDTSTNNVLDTLNGNFVAAVKPSGTGLEINGKTFNSQSVTLVPVTVLSDNVSKLSGKSYRGSLIVSNKNGNISVINMVQLDDYLIGTVPAEMSPTWPAAALQAQSVAARTYALNSKNRHVDEGFDICNASHCQVYDGTKSETNTTTEAVNSTRGYAMIYNSEPIFAAFHSSSGGMTENIEDVWGTYLPYLRSVQDDDSQSPYHNWSVTYTPAQVERMLSGRGHNIGTLQSIQLMPNASTKAVKSTSGRSNTIKFTGSNGSATLSGVDLRSVMGLKSTMFSISVKQNYSNTKAGSASGEHNNLSPNSLKVTGVEGEQIVIDGHGFGHGLGLAQWGAKAMAEQGKTWQNILNHYYTNVSIRKMY